jgi:hypothetical protein
MSANKTVKFITDAFGDQMVLNDIYGYAGSNNGILRSFYGEVIKISDKQYATVKIIKKFTALYATNPVVEPKESRDISIVKCNHLIHISKNKS